MEYIIFLIPTAILNFNYKTIKMVTQIQKTENTADISVHTYF